MAAFVKGDVVVVPFPFSGLTNAKEISEKAITPVRAKHSADDLWLSAKIFARMLRPYDLRVSIFLGMA